MQTGKIYKGETLISGGGSNGKDGKSAYQIWLDAGNVGTEADFLASLKGDTGVSADYPITIHNGLDSTATDEALSAAQGKLLDGKVTQLGREVNGDITKEISWSNGYVQASTGVVRTSTASKFSQPFLLKAGEKVTIGTQNSNIGIICSTNADSVAVGDTVTVIKRTSSSGQFESYEYTATEDIKIVLCVLASNYNLSFYDTDNLTEKIGNAATKQELNSLGQEVEGQSFTQPTMDDVLHGSLSSSATWNAGSNYSLVMPLGNLGGFHITGYAIQYAFLKQWIVEGVISPAFVDGGSRISGTISNVEIPSDAKYLYVYLGNNQPTSVPSYAFAEPLSPGIIGLEEQINDVVGDVSELNTKTAGFVHTRNLADSVEQVNAYIGSTGVMSGTSANDKSIIFPCQPSTTYTISKILSNRFRIAYYNTYPVRGAQGGGYQSDNAQTSLTITTASDSQYIVAFLWSNDSVSWDAIMASLQIEIGSTATPYVAPAWIPDPSLDARVGALESVAQTPNIHISATSNKVSVYFKLNGNYYGRLNINHIVKHTDADYADFWAIEGTTIAELSAIASYSGGAYTDLPVHLLNTPENEFAIQFYASDFTGGYHGDERIDIETGCYVVFIVDGKEYTISELVTLGSADCSSFGYRQKSALYSIYSETSAHNVIAYHTKRTDFVNGGYVTRNYVEMVEALTCKVAYSGLVCVHKDCADYVINNAGDSFTLSHPTTITPVAGFANKTDSEVKMYKGGASCILSSRVVGGNVTSFNKPTIEISDRQNDGKYYAVMPYNVALSVGSVFEFECAVSWNYKG